MLPVGESVPTFSYAKNNFFKVKKFGEKGLHTPNILNALGLVVRHHGAKQY